MNSRPFDPSKLPDANFEAPSLIGAVEGWRAWRIASEPPKYGVAPKLFSHTQQFYWTPRQKSEAECCFGSHKKKAVVDDTTGLLVVKGEDIPGENCACGFYSAKDLKHLLTMPYPSYDPYSGFYTVIGQVANWGKVIEGSLGWRAQFSYPVKLYLPFEAGLKLAKPLKDAYGVPVGLKNWLKPRHANH